MTQSGTGRLFVISGAQAAGKSTVGRALAEALPRSVFVDGDTIGNFVLSGKELMTEPPRTPAIEQLFLRYAGALTVADVYRSAGFDAVIADNIFGSFLNDYLMIAAPEPVHFVMLNASADIIRAREIARGGNAYRDGFTVEGLVSSIEHDTLRVGLWIDNTVLTAGQTVAQILRHTDDALVDTREFANPPADAGDAE
ncbi:AAA family ATPase [Flexivirga caeni]|uniref:Phosphotransferase n=1 Tax=Flexivirga caeni TaxID=2294115 RepID=A0A3M9M5L4_9MICO|nr:AAA family ATPase [Flexivirga caeni]RNI20869.1 phosphotransferase [Flexivirga caeni]